MMRISELLQNFEQKFEIFVKSDSSIPISKNFDSVVIFIYFGKPHGTSTFYSNISKIFQLILLKYTFFDRVK